MSSYTFRPEDDVPATVIDGRVISLNDARAAFGRTAGVDRDLWSWSPGELRWLIGHWFIFRRELALCEYLADDLADLELSARPAWFAAYQSFGRGLAWHLAAPLALRGLVVAAILFAYAFALGRF